MIDMYHILSNVNGWLSEQDAGLLIKYAKEVASPNVIVEIGSFLGRSTLVMCLATNVPIYSIDPHAQSIGDPYDFNDKDREVFCRNLLNFGMAGRVRQVNLNSGDVGLIWDKLHYPVGFLFIDGRHDYHGVFEDITTWIDNMARGSYIAFHDTYAPQINDAIKQFSRLEFIEGGDITAVYRVKNE